MRGTMSVPRGMPRTATGPSAIAAVVAVAATCLLLAPAPAAAQSSGGSGTHHGFWLSGGLGGGVNDNGDGGGGFYIRMGGTLSQHLVIGGEAIGMSRDASGTTISQGNALFDVLLYPSPTSGGFLKAGIGFATYQVSDEIQGVTVSADESGAGAVLGAGWDIHLGSGNLYLTPNADVLFQEFHGFDTVDTIFLFTVGIGFH